MSPIEKTAYPRFPKRKKIRPDELSRSYSLRQDEINMISLATNTDKSRFNMAIQLKTFQRLGYFVETNKIPSEIIVHIRQSLKYHYRLTPGYGDNNKSLYRHRQKIREFLHVKRWGYEDISGKKIHPGLKLAIQYAYDASHSMNNIPDIINAVIEKRVEASYELPSFYRLSRLVCHTRHTVNNKIFHDAMKKITTSSQSGVFSKLLTLQDHTQRSLFNQIKNLPKRPGINNFHEFLDHFHWLMSFGSIMHCLDGIAKVKIEQFAEEANQLTADELNECSEAKRYTLIASLIYRSQAHAKDALAMMFCRLISIAHKQSNHALIQEGHTITEEDLSHMSPYITEQIKRFGEYVLDLARRPANLYTTRDKFLFKARNEELQAVA